MTFKGFKPDTNETHIEKLFNITKHHLDYAILKNTTRIEGVWVLTNRDYDKDDHDYNNNNGDKSNPTKHMIR